uniref:Baculoviral IAP repeat-containing protein n=1 Tax=Trachysalambria curvirostris nimavirus TaxID=2984282 RepID=A0A9C7BR30_9VIRU|nr:MAG: baculoviral IAP repeat-containing protein [Trachysalambria curvirostris nimavirus]
MGDHHTSLQREEYRLSTFGDHGFSVDKKILAMAGFYFTKRGDDVKCFDCNLEFDAKSLKATDDIAMIHRERSRDCVFAQSLDMGLFRIASDRARGAPSPRPAEGIRLNRPGRSKTFLSYDSLRYEKERLETFIDWPIEWLNPADLSADGFYYLRTADHCACIFCRGVVGAWEVGDTPRGEHQRHFPHCTFIRGKPVGNVPIIHSNILARLPVQENEPQNQATTHKPGADICGTPIFVTGGSPNKTDISLAAIGLPQYSGPKRRDFITTESRMGSFVGWPERVSQRPTDLAEAGFFYCGLSDHVRCFHCGNGLRNWEEDDIPWNEHATYYPECNFVLLKKGQDFIDKVRREKPPYALIAPAVKPTINKYAATTVLGSGSAAHWSLSDHDLDRLMDLDTVRHVLAMGFPTHIVRAVLRDRVKETGMPYFNTQPYIEAVLQKLEEEFRRSPLYIECLSETQDVHNTPRRASEDTTGTSPTPPPQTPPIIMTSDLLPDLPPEEEMTRNIETSNTNAKLGTAHEQPQEPQTSTSTTTPDVSSGTEDMEIDETGRGVTPTGRVITQADVAISMAEEVPRSPSSGPPLSLGSYGKVEEGAGNVVPDQPSSLGVRDCGGALSSPQSSDKLADELERIRDSRMCKVCMGTEMDVVFLPCAHMIACANCAAALVQCPICRKDIRYTIKPIVS